MLDIPIREIAARQLADYRARNPGTFFEQEHSPLSLEDAYAVQFEVMKARTDEGEWIDGFKVGCTGSDIRELFGLDGPIRGFVYESELHRSGDRISHSEFANLAIEGEIAVRLGDDLEPKDVFPVIELHNNVFRAPSRSLQELIANNGIHAGVVLPKDRAAQWRTRPKSGMLRVFVNESLVGEGPMYGVPGGPEGSLDWLKGNLKEYGLELEPSQLILTGTPLGLHPVHPGDEVRVIADLLGTVEMTVVA